MGVEICSLIMIWADLRLLWPTLIFAVTLLVAAVLIRWADRWRKDYSSESAVSANEQLAAYRVLYDQGELSKEEFEKLREKLSGQLVEEVGRSGKEEKPDEKSDPDDRADEV